MALELLKGLPEPNVLLAFTLTAPVFPKCACSSIGFLFSSWFLGAVSSVSELVNWLLMAPCPWGRL